MADSPPDTSRPRFPRVPAHAWSWLQRSRPVLDEVAQRLTGRQPTPAFLDGLHAQLATDRFVQDVVIAVVAEVAFNGRVPTRRPAGTAWDRGLTWWAATISGTTPQEFEARSGPPPASQRPLFGPEPAETPPAVARTHAVATVPRRPPAAGRAAIAAVLRQLLDAADGDQIPAVAVHQLLADIEGEQTGD